MTQSAIRGALIAMLALSLPFTPALAQDSTNRVAAATDWSVFVEETPTKSCWIVSQPKETLNTRDGKPAEVTRGKILLYVSYFAGSAGEVSFAGGLSLRARTRRSSWMSAAPSSNCSRRTKPPGQVLPMMMPRSPRR